MVKTRGQSKAKPPTQPVQTKKKTPEPAKTRPTRMSTREKTVSADRKKTMEAYNKTISDAKKTEYKKNKIILGAKNGTTKSVRASTLKRFTWTDEEQKFLQQYVIKPRDIRADVIRDTPMDSDNDEQIFPDDPDEDDNVEVEDDEYFKRMLTCHKVSEHFWSRGTQEKTTINWISNIRVICNAAVGNFNFNHYTRPRKTNSKPRKNANVYTPDNDDFRKVLDLSPTELFDKFNDRPIKYKNSTLLAKIKTVGNVTRKNEYGPAIAYLKKKGNYEEYSSELQTLLNDKKIELQSEGVDAIKEINIKDIYGDFVKFFALERGLRGNRNQSYAVNQQYLVVLLYTIGIFNGMIGASHVGFVPRLLRKILLVKPPASVISPTYKRNDPKDWGAMWYDDKEKQLMSKGPQAHKTGHTYPYEHNYIEFVYHMIDESLIRFPNNGDGELRTKLIDDKSEVISNTFKDKFTEWTDTNTKYRKFIDTVFQFIGESREMRIQLAKALAHSVTTSITTYQMKIPDRSNSDEWRKKFIDFLEKLNNKYIKDYNDIIKRKVQTTQRNKNAGRYVKTKKK
jgi:hypothetical protein